MKYHILNYHEYNTRNNISKYHLQNINVIEYIKIYIFNFIFETYEYIIIKIDVFNFKIYVYLNIDDEVNLINKSMFSRDIYIHHTQFIIIIDVCNKQIINKYIFFTTELKSNKYKLEI